MSVYKLKEKTMKTFVIKRITTHYATIEADSLEEALYAAQHLPESEYELDDVDSYMEEEFAE
jgi:hypothetical protein